MKQVSFGDRDTSTNVNVAALPPLEYSRTVESYYTQRAGHGGYEITESSTRPRVGNQTGQQLLHS